MDPEDYELDTDFDEPDYDDPDFSHEDDEEDEE